jgi:hypothetical protein
MQTVTTIGLDIAKSVFQVHGVDAVGQVVIRRWRRFACSAPLERFTDLLNRQGFRTWGEYDSRCWLGWRPASDGATNFQ